jgi:hypothetical protein
LLEVQPVNEKPPNSIKPSIQKLLENYEPRPISESTVPQRKVYSPHPRVQRMFKKLLMLRQQREKELANSKNDK